MMDDTVQSKVMSDLESLRHKMEDALHVLEEQTKEIRGTLEKNKAGNNR